MRLTIPSMQRIANTLPALAPPIAVVALVLFAGGERIPAQDQPSMTPAEMPAEFSAITVAARPRPTNDAASRAAARTAELTTAFAMASPFGRIEEHEPAHLETGGPAPRPDLRAHLTSLMNTPRGAIAVIDGRPRRVGDRIADAATITAIDLETRTVTAALDGGHEVVLTLAQPGEPTGR